MRTALITGAAGVMGARLTARLRKAGWNVRALVMPGDPLRSRVERLGCEVRRGRRERPEQLCAAFATAWSMVYHLAAVIISHDPSVFRTGESRRHGEHRRARRGAAASGTSCTCRRRRSPTRVAPATPSRSSRPSRSSQALACPYTIVRPTLVYERGGGQELMMFLDYLKRFPVVPFIGSGAALKRPVWSEDVVDGLARLAGAAIAHGKTYNFSGGEAISMRELAELLLQYHDRPRPLLPLPVWACRAAGGDPRRVHEEAAAHVERHRRHRQRRQSGSERGHARSRLRAARGARRVPTLLLRSPYLRGRHPFYQRDIDRERTRSDESAFTTRTPGSALCSARSPHARRCRARHQRARTKRRRPRTPR